MNGIIIKKKIHELYSSHKINSFYAIGKWHYFYINKNHKIISLIRIHTCNGWKWEAWGYRMHYERRFNTRKQAEKYIKDRLT